MSDYYSSSAFIFSKINERKRNINILNLTILGVWLVAILVSVFFVFIEDFTFFRSQSPQAVSIDMLSPDLVEDSPYIKLSDMCFEDNMYWLEEESEVSYFYCARTCDSSKIEFNSVIFVLPTEMEDLDTNNLDYELFSGKMSNGIDVSSAIDGKLKWDWSLKESGGNVFTFRAGYHPKDEMINDLLYIGGALLVGFILTGAMFQLKRSFHTEIAAWRDNYYRAHGERCPI